MPLPYNEKNTLNIIVKDSLMRFLESQSTREIELLENNLSKDYYNHLRYNSTSAANIYFFMIEFISIAIIQTIKKDKQFDKLLNVNSITDIQILINYLDKIVDKHFIGIFNKISSAPLSLRKTKPIFNNLIISLAKSNIKIDDEKQVERIKPLSLKNSNSIAIKKTTSYRRGLSSLFKDYSNNKMTPENYDDCLEPPQYSN